MNPHQSSFNLWKLLIHNEERIYINKNALSQPINVYVMQQDKDYKKLIMASFLDIPNDDDNKFQLGIEQSYDKEQVIHVINQNNINMDYDLLLELENLTSNQFIDQEKVLFYLHSKTEIIIFIKRGGTTFISAYTFTRHEYFFEYSRYFLSRIEEEDGNITNYSDIQHSPMLIEMAIMLIPFNHLVQQPYYIFNDLQKLCIDFLLEWLSKNDLIPQIQDLNQLQAAPGHEGLANQFYTQIGNPYIFPNTLNNMTLHTASLKSNNQNDDIILQNLVAIIKKLPNKFQHVPVDVLFHFSLYGTYPIGQYNLSYIFEQIAPYYFDAAQPKIITDSSVKINNLQTKWMEQFKNLSFLNLLGWHIQFPSNF